MNVTSSDSAQIQVTQEVITTTRPGHALLLDDRSPVGAVLAADAYAHTKAEKETDRSETAEKSRPFVSDRYLKKANFGLTDDEIDAYHEGRADPLEAQGVNLAERQPPGIGDLVYSLATGEGPYSLLEYEQRDVSVDGGGTRRVVCGLCRTGSGGYKSIPLADLALHYIGRPIVKKRRRWLPVFVVLTSSLVGSLVALAYYVL